MSDHSDTEPLPGNPHATLAEYAAEQLPCGGSWPEGTGAAAQAYATLALAYEQRTATLAALMSTDFLEPVLTQEEWASVQDQLRARLGLDGGER